MTKEQEEVIERLKRIDVKFFISGMNEASNYIIDEADKVNNAIETVLNMLKEKDELYHKALGDLAKADRENIKKDKIIDLMADFIDKTGAGRRAFSCTFRKNDECNENGCRYCIKQYFKEIAERKGEK